MKSLLLVTKVLSTETTLMTCQQADRKNEIKSTLSRIAEPKSRDKPAQKLEIDADVPICHLFSALVPVGVFYI